MLPLLLLLLSDPIQSAVTPAVVPPTVPPTVPPAPTEKKVCWRDQVTGSMMPPRKICMTVAERRAWVARMQGNVNALNDRRQRAATPEM